MKDDKLVIKSLETRMMKIDEKLESVHDAVIGLTVEVRNMSDNLKKQNGRVTRLEKAHEDNIRADAKLTSRLESHMTHDEKEFDRFREKQDQIFKKLDSMNTRLSIGFGVVSVVGFLLPLLITLYTK